MVKKSDMVKAIAAKAGLTQVQSEAMFDAFLEAFTEELAKGEKVQFMGIGSFEVKNRPARVSRNPRTGEAVDVAASNYVSFSCGKKLKEAVQAAKTAPAKKPAKAKAKTASAEAAPADAKAPKAEKPAAKKTTAKKSSAKKKTEAAK